MTEEEKTAAEQAEKELFLTLKSYEEFDARRHEFKYLKWDQDIVNHMAKIFPKPYTGKEELYKTKPEPGKGRNIGM